MITYSYGQARQRLEVILERALREGGVRLRGKNGQLFIIRPDTTKRRSPLDVSAVLMGITREDILESVAESRMRE